MSKRRKVTYFASDFETTTDDPEKVQVWSAETIQIGKGVEAISENCFHQNTIHDYMQFIRFKSAKTGNMIVYFHNLKFDGSYILDYLAKSDEYTEYSEDVEDETGSAETVLIDKETKRAKIPNMHYTYTINDRNVMYTITIQYGKYQVEFRDSLKILPFTLKKLAKDFELPHQKLEMDYGHKYPGYKPNAMEMQYIENDVFVLKEAIEKFVDLIQCGNDIPMTIGSACLKDYKILIAINEPRDWKDLFPSQLKTDDCELEDYIRFDEYVRRSYKGGWCYVSPRIKGRPIYGTGYVYDVNSLYPSMMHSQSGSFYPYGYGYYSKGDISETEKRQYKNKNLYYFVHVKTEFHLKPEHVPCIQIKGNYMYNAREWLESSDVSGVPNIADLYLTCVDWELIKEQYDLKNTQIISHISYTAITGIFDSYIDKWYGLKAQATKDGNKSLRTICKLALNNLYGKFSTAADASYQVMKVNPETGAMYGETVTAYDPNKIVYIPIGSAITSWARNFTIRHAQANYANFCYADTDSLHMTGEPEDAKMIVEHSTNLCAWKCEHNWDSAIFAGQKRYIEHDVKEDRQDIQPTYDVKCCGMGKEAKSNVVEWLETGRNAEGNKFGLGDFKTGLVVPGNLKGHRVNGGIFLQEQEFHFR